MTTQPYRPEFLPLINATRHQQASVWVKLGSVVTVTVLLILAATQRSCAALPWSLALLGVLAQLDAAHTAQAQRHAKLHNEFVRKNTGNGGTGSKALEREWLMLPEPEPFPEAAFRLFKALGSPSVLWFHLGMLAIALPLSGLLDAPKAKPSVARAGCGSGGCGSAGGCGTGGCGASSGGACGCGSGKTAKVAASSVSASRPVTVPMPVRPSTVALPSRSVNGQPRPLPLRPVGSATPVAAKAGTGSMPPKAPPVLQRQSASPTAATAPRPGAPATPSPAAPSPVPVPAGGPK